LHAALGAVGAGNRWAAVAASLQSRMTHTAHAHVVILLLDDLWQFFFYIGLYETHKHLDTYFLIHNCQDSVILVGCLNERWKQYFFEFFIMEIGDG
jgi:hypothetical protein